MRSIRLKRVLVTGAGGGLGKAVSERFLRHGAEVVLTDLNADALAAAHEDLRGLGPRAWAHRLDVTDPEAIAEVRDRVHADAGGIDILVNNAGVVFGGPFLEVPLERHRLTYRVNVEGVVNMTHAFLPDLIDSPRGHLINIASASGFIGLPNGSTYASSKWAVIGFTESIRLEMQRLGHKNVDVTSICPSYIATGMFQGVAPPKGTEMLTPEAIAERILEAVDKRKIWVLEPWLVKVTPFLKGVLPTKMSDFVADLFGASHSMDDWTGHEGRAPRPAAAEVEG